jgi:hypothetical protein
MDYLDGLALGGTPADRAAADRTLRTVLAEVGLPPVPPEATLEMLFQYATIAFVSLHLMPNDQKQ